MASSFCDSAHVRPDARRVATTGLWVPRVILAACALVLAGAQGCSELSTSSTNRDVSGATPLKIPAVPTDAAFDAGLIAMRQYFNHVDAVRTDGRLVSGWAEYDQKGGTGRFRDATLNFKNRMRRRATLWISGAESGSVAKCQVRRQRLDTADHRIFQQQQQFNDLPNSTPIDRDAGTTTDQNQAWTDMQRDRKMERELLQVLLNVASKSDHR